ncbi:MAG: hypothetical protein M1431_05870 [Candidatus Thermoplasmatota archaeon]|nr:hypothetical protein [Candidatus Thermoplasmatota archaeon]
MKRLMVLSVMFLLVAVPAVSYAQVPQHPSGNIMPFSYPTVEITVNKTTSFNLSLEKILLVRDINNQHFAYSAILRMGRWNAKSSSDNISYSSTLFMRPDITGSMMSPGNPFPKSMQQPLTVHVEVNITRYGNNSYPYVGNNSINSTLEITYYLKFSKQVPGTGYVVIAQGIAENSRFNFFTLKPQVNSFDRHGHDFGRGLVFSNSTTNSTFAEFWWKNNYELNGITQNVSSNYTISNNRESLILFRYNYTNGVSTIFQDPYFTIYGLNIFSYPVIKQELDRAYNFLIIHIEELIAGVGIGTGLIGMTYASYRRRKF